jgi:HSP20 family protein
MKTLARWNPFRELAPFATFPDMETFFGEFPFRPVVRGYEPVATMPIDIVEAPTLYTAKVEIPGMKKEDIAVSIDGSTVTITAEAVRENAVNDNEKVLRNERYYGSLYRMFTLPVEVDPAKAEASYDAGVLTLVLPKAPGTIARNLPVH